MKSLKNKIQNLILLVISTILTIPKIVWGATVENIGPQSGLTMFDFRPYIFNICTVILGVIGLVSIMMLIYGTAVWFTAGGNEDWEDHAKRLFFGAGLGLILVFTSWALYSSVFQGIAQAAG